MKLSSTVRVLCVTAAVVPCRAQTLVRSVSGPAANAQYGRACIRVPDQNADGFDDLLVGAPGFNQQRGAIYCLSGAYLAFGTGQQTLWSLAPSALPGDLFGYAIADAGDVTGDGVHDYVVGQPGYTVGSGFHIGAVRLVNGASHTAVSTIWGFEPGCALGTAVASCADANGNGKREIVVGGPGPSSSSSRVYSFDGSQLALTNSIDVISSSFVGGAGSDELGASIAGGFDVDGNGFDEFVLGAPGSDNGPLTSAGRVVLFEIRGVGTAYLGSYSSSVVGERLGTSVDGGYDYDGDGVLDIVAGAPNSPDGSGSELGRALVLSGAQLIAQMPPYELRTLTTQAGPLVGGSDFHFGAAVRASGDLNGDGVGEILVGAPDYFTTTPFLKNFGFAALYSGASGTRLATLFGALDDHFGDALAGALDDLDGDGFKEFVVAGGLSDANGADSGVVKCYRLFPIAPATYCTGKLNSLGCTPSIAFSGTPKANPTAPFLITASNFLNQKNGLLFYSSAPTAVAFQGGFKCAANPTVRTPPMSSGGASSGSSCTGTYSFDFNDWIVNGWDQALGAGSEIYAQYWSRDPQSPSHTSLSNALRFVINP